MLLIETARWLAAGPGRLWNRFGQILDHGYPVARPVLSIYRIFYGTYLLVFNAVPDLRWIADYPGVFYDPAPGLPALWGGFLPLWALVGLELGLIAAVCAMLIGWRTPAMSIAVTVIGYTANSAYFTFGKIDHTFMTWIVPALLAFSGWGALYSLDSLRRSAAINTGAASNTGAAINTDAAPDTGDEPTRSLEAQIAPSWPVVVVGAFLAHSFLTAALPKILRGWLSFETSAVRRHFLQLAYQLERDQLLAGTFLDFEWRPFWESLDWAGVGLEAALVLSLLWPLVHRWLILGAWLFHLVNLLLLNISFYGPLPVYPLFLLPLIGPGIGVAVGRFVMRHRRLLVGLVLPVLAGLAFFRQGLVWAVAQDVFGVGARSADVVVFTGGFLSFAALAVLTKGYRHSIGRATAPTAT
jgi:hypothetical protein